MNNLKEKEKENAFNEVRILASISDEFIVGYKEAFIDSQDLCLIMEYCPKGDIAKKITECTKQRKYIDEADICKALVDILKGLKSLH